MRVRMLVPSSVWRTSKPAGSRRDDDWVCKVCIDERCGAVSLQCWIDGNSVPMSGIATCVLGVGLITCVAIAFV